jgi:hypothetical protein
MAFCRAPVSLPDAALADFDVAATALALSDFAEIAGGIASGGAASDRGCWLSAAAVATGGEASAVGLVCGCG